MARSRSDGWWRKIVQVGRQRKKTRTGWWLSAAESGWVVVVGLTAERLTLL